VRTEDGRERSMMEALIAARAWAVYVSSEIYDLCNGSPDWDRLKSMLEMGKRISEFGLLSKATRAGINLPITS